MSGSSTFDTEKNPQKNRNRGILRLRLAYGRRSKNMCLILKPVYESCMNDINKMQETSLQVESQIRYN